MERRDGQTLAEYALLLLFIALACIAATSLLGRTVQGLYIGFNGSF
jgi:Flp pilus assembly pilin Flp